MPAKKLKCTVCGCLFYATRSDTKYHSQRCRYKARAEDAKFEVPRLPQSGIEGVTFSRIRKRWEVRIQEGETWKYCGAFKTLEEAIQFQRGILASELS